MARWISAVGEVEARQVRGGVDAPAGRAGEAGVDDDRDADEPGEEHALLPACGGRCRCRSAGRKRGEHVAEPGHDPQEVEGLPRQREVDEVQGDEADAMIRIMITGSRKRQNQKTPNVKLPSRWPGWGRNHRCLNCFVTWTLPRAQRRRCFHRESMLPGLLGPDHGVGLEDDPSAAQLGFEGGEGVFGQRRGVDPAADGDEVLAGVQLGSAGQAGQRARARSGCGGPRPGR